LGWSQRRGNPKGRGKPPLLKKDMGGGGVKKRNPPKERRPAAAKGVRGAPTRFKKGGVPTNRGGGTPPL